MIGCGDKESEKKDIYELTKNVKGSVLIHSDQLIDPWVISNIDSLLIIGNKKGDPLIEVYDYEGKLKNKLMKRGKKPNEIIMIGSFQADYLNNRIYVYDLFDKKLFSLPIDKILKRDYQPQLLYDFKKIILPTSSYEKVYVCNDFFIAESRSPQGRFLISDNSGKKIKFTANYPNKVDTSLSDKENAYLYAGTIALSPDKSKLAFATYNAGLLDFFKFDPAELKPLWKNHEFLPTDLKRMQVEGGNNTVIAYSNKSVSGYPDISVTDRFVYSIFSGKTFETNDYNFSNVIRVTSWDGKKRYKLILDRSINRISVSKDDSKIFAISKNAKGEPEIVKFDIHTLIK